MDKLKLSIRPNIATIKTELNNSTTEEFQNKTLRPILKLQNDLILLYFENYIQNNKLILQTSDKNLLHNNIQKIFQKNQLLKKSLIALVIGLFTTNEYQDYNSNNKEYNKRIIAMMIQRICNNLLVAQ